MFFSLHEITMSVYKYTYTVDVDFGGTQPNLTRLHNEVNDDPGIEPICFNINQSHGGNNVNIKFLQQLDGGEQTALDNVVANHNGLAVNPLIFLNTSGSTNTTMTLNAAQTSNRTITIPDATTTLVGTNASQILTNKTINLLNNSLSNLVNANIASGAAIDASKIHDASVSNTEFGYLNGVTSAIQTQINSKGDASGPGSSMDMEVARFNGTGGKTLEGAGVRDYGASATDPTVPTPQAGDKYYNTAINHDMRYDASRGKWLSVATFFDGAGRNGTTAADVYYKRFNGMSLAAAQGPHIPKGTIIRIGYSTSVAVTHTYEVLVGGSVVASLASGGAASAFDDTVNANFNAGILSSRNATGSATTTNLQSVIYYKLRV